MAASTDKITRFDEFMKFDHVLVHLDSRKEGVVVPAHLRGNPSLTLKLSYQFQGEITYDPENIIAYLKFAGNYEQCTLPWGAIWGLTCSNKQQAIWPDDLPKEIVVSMAKEQLSSLASKVFGRKKEKKESKGTEASEKVTNIADKQKKSHLKRIK